MAVSSSFTIALPRLRLFPDGPGYHCHQHGWQCRTHHLDGSEPSTGKRFAWRKSSNVGTIRVAPPDLRDSDLAPREKPSMARIPSATVGGSASPTITEIGLDAR